MRLSGHEVCVHSVRHHISRDEGGGMVDIRDRRPVALSPELAGEWLDPATAAERAEQIVPYQDEPADAFTWYTG